MQQKNLIWLGVVIGLLLAAGGGYYYYRTQYLPAQEPAESETLQTAKVRRGDLTVSAAGAGVVIAGQETALSFRSGGVLLEVAVRPGSVVTAGQVLAQLDPAEAQGQLAQAEANLQLAQLKRQQVSTSIAQAEATLTLAQLKLTQAASTQAQAEAQVNLAQLKLDTLTTPADAVTLGIAQANLLSAQADLSNLLSGPSTQDLAIAQVDLEQAALNVQQAQTAYDKVAWGDDVGISPQAAALQVATLNYQKAMAAYEQKTDSDNASQIAAAQAKVLQAQQTYNNLIAGPDPEALAVAELSLSQAQAALETAQDTTALALAVTQAEAALAMAQDTTALDIAVAQAQLTRDTAQRNLNNLSLKAPFAGTVVSVNASVGESVGTSPIITLVDLSQAQIELYVDETDFDKLSLGYPVEAVFDALPDLIYPGQVVQVNPLLTTIDGVPALSAVATLSPATANPVGSVNRLLPGMNAAVEIIAGSAEDALLIPVEALRELGPAQYAVFVMVEGEPQMRVVEVGLMDFSYAEIISGLAQGDVVTTGIVETE